MPGFEPGDGLDAAWVAIAHNDDRRSTFETMVLTVKHAISQLEE